VGYDAVSLSEQLQTFRRYQDFSKRREPLIQRQRLVVEYPDSTNNYLPDVIFKAL
jgi:hypothetical protein